MKMTLKISPKVLPNIAALSKFAFEIVKTTIVPSQPIAPPQAKTLIIDAGILSITRPRYGSHLFCLNETKKKETSFPASFLFRNPFLDNY